MSTLDELVSQVIASPKYRWLCPDTIRRLGERELAKGRGLKAAVKATKSRLHQAFGAFDRAPDYDRLLAVLEAARKPGSGDAFREACRSTLACHASTRERLPILDRFYAEIFAVTGRPNRVLDLACGLHPLGLPWMGLPPDVAYTALDIDGRAVKFLNLFFGVATSGSLVDQVPSRRFHPFPPEGFTPSGGRTAGETAAPRAAAPEIRARAVLQDILCQPPDDPADVAFLLKTLPCLERQEKGSSRRLLESLRARHIVVSFPVASLGGRGKGMRENYERGFTEMAKDGPWQIERLTFPTELVFVVKK